MNSSADSLIIRCLSQGQQVLATVFEKALGGEVHIFGDTVNKLKNRQHKVRRKTAPVAGHLAVEAAMAIAGRNVGSLCRSRAQVDVP